MYSLTHELFSYRSKYVTKLAEIAPQKLSTDAAITTDVVELNAAMIDPWKNILEYAKLWKY